VKELTKRGGTQDKMKSISLEETAEAIRHYVKDRSQIKEIIEKYG